MKVGAESSSRRFRLRAHCGMRNPWNLGENGFYCGRCCAAAAARHAGMDRSNFCCLLKRHDLRIRDTAMS